MGYVFESSNKSQQNQVSLGWEALRGVMSVLLIGDIRWGHSGEVWRRKVIEWAGGGGGGGG